MNRVFFVFLVALTELAFTSTQARAQAPAPAAQAEKCKIVVLTLVGRALAKGDEELPAILTESLAGEIGVVSGCDVVSQGDIVAMLDFERQKAVCTDGNDSCLAEIGQALGADRVVAGTVGKLGTQFIVIARLMNVRKGEVEARAEEPVSGGAEQLRGAAKNVGRRLFGMPPLTVGQIASEGHDQGLPPLFWAGTAAGSVGLAVAVVGGAVAFIANEKLGEPQETDKDGVQNEGLIALGVAGLGGALAITGGVLVAVALME